MSVSENKKLVKKYLSALASMDWKTLETCLHPDFIFYPQVDTPFHGIAGFLEAEEKAFQAFSELNVYPVYLVAEDNYVASLTMFEFTHADGPYFGMRPQGKSGRVTIGMFFEIKDGLIFSKRAHYDKADFWKQMGADKLDEYIQSL